MRILGIETSCDETAAAVIEDGRVVRSNVVASQAEIHARYGGVVPEVASRQHIMAITGVVRAALDDAEVELGDLDGIGVTCGPGLAGSLLVGVNAAKGLALAADLPLWGINHLEGHVYATWLEDLDPALSPGFPLMCLIVSGGHTDLALMRGHGRFELVGRTRDDAAGEAFDKAARLLGLGYPGGPAIQKAAAGVVGGEKPFTRPKIRDSFDFSYSGLKTAVLQRARERGVEGGAPGPSDRGRIVREIAAAFQEAVVDSLVTRTIAATAELGARGIILCGGVAANAALREEMALRAEVPVLMPRPSLCTDNAAMIGAAAHHVVGSEGPGAARVREWSMDVIPGLAVGGERPRSG